MRSFERMIGSVLRNVAVKIAERSITQQTIDVGDLPPFPQAAQKALRLIRNPDTSIKELSRVISVDQTLSGLLLRWANSAWFSLHPMVSR